MAWDFKELKRRKKPEFHKNYEKYYPVKSLGEMGFSRKVCVKCGRGFWSAVDRDYCDEPACSGGYRFIGEKLTRKRFRYKEAWDEYVKTFKKWGYVPIKRYPVVCRWYDELYFVNAGINDFQPYVVSGLVEPPADAVLEPQFCLRFSDIDSVGITGRHYTGFIMAGQHAFRTPEKPDVYFKEEGIRQMHEFLTNGLGIKAEEIFYHEDVWAGGGNFGPSMEFFSRGLELGNQVYMQYEVLPDGTSRELRTKVIDMGAGLERWSWFSQGTAMSYDTVFPKVMGYLYKRTGAKDSDLWKRFAGFSGLLDIGEINNINSVWSNVVSELGVGMDELKGEVYRRRALYSIADHSRSLLVAMHDGALPSNVGGGYNLRDILRRCWSLMDEFKFDFSLEEVFKLHVTEFGSWFTELKETGSLFDILEVEEKRYLEGKEKGKKLVERMVKKKEKFTPDRLVELYVSQGIDPELIRESKPDLNIPENFYSLVEKRHGEAAADVKRGITLGGDFPDTERLYYEKEGEEFEAAVLGTSGDYVVLDRTLFYPEGGGQESDLGEINGIKVSDVQKVGNVIAHKVEDVSKFKPKQKVTGRIDYDRRMQLAQHHTATHIVNAAAGKVLGPHVWQAGAHKSVETSRLDITHYKAVGDDELRKIEAEANKIVNKKIPVNIHVMKRNEAEEKYGFRLYQGGAVPGLELRIVEIAGIDAEACGGTHLKNTSETGKIEMVSAKRIQDGVVRLEFKAGRAAVIHGGEEERLFEKSMRLIPADIKDKKFDRHVLSNAAGAFSVPVKKLPETIERFVQESQSMGTVQMTNTPTLATASEELFAEWKRLRKERGRTETSEAEKLISNLDKKFQATGEIKQLTEDLSVKALKDIAQHCTGTKGRTIILLNISGESANVVVASSSGNSAEKIAKDLSSKLGGGANGDDKFAIGGGKSKGAKKILDEFRI